jgi:hypothetical protein
VRRVVEDRITDGERIAQLLASELTGLDVSPLDAVSVVDADRDVSPSSDGPVAYRIQYREEPLGEVRIYPDHARLRLDGSVGGSPESLHTVEGVAETADSLSVIGGVDDADDSVVVRIGSGAAVKSAVDLIRDLLASD